MGWASHFDLARICCGVERYLERPGQRYFASFIAEEGSFWYGPDMRIGGALDAEPATRMERDAV